MCAPLTHIYAALKFSSLWYLKRVQCTQHSTHLFRTISNQHPIEAKKKVANCFRNENSTCLSNRTYVIRVSSARHNGNNREKYVLHKYYPSSVLGFAVGTNAKNLFLVCFKRCFFLSLLNFTAPHFGRTSHFSHIYMYTWNQNQLVVCS